jgi:hypothetical protein
MENMSYKKIVENAKTLFDMTQMIQDTLLDLFFDEFVEIDDEEIRMKQLSQEPPF